MSKTGFKGFNDINRLMYEIEHLPTPQPEPQPVTVPADFPDMLIYYLRENWKIVTGSELEMARVEAVLDALNFVMDALEVADADKDRVRAAILPEGMKVTREA